jgi:RimJ/RimL family protein N-acetyltransferase
MKLIEKTITQDEKEVGYICILTYPHFHTPFIQYHVDAEYQNQGIMSRELPIFLKSCKKHSYNQICAMVKDDNIASIRLLEKNNFIPYKSDRNIITYLTDLRFTQQELKKMVNDYKGIKS